VKIVVCIPARYASTRFAGKVLAKDTGKYLVQHTYEQACKARLPEKVIIAADDEKIVTAAAELGAACVLTSPAHQSGTDRIAEAVGQLDVDIVINVQGDEPEIDPDHIDYLAELLVENPDYPMATLATPLHEARHVADPNVVKVIVSSQADPVGWGLPHHGHRRGVCGGASPTLPVAEKPGQAQGPAPTHNAMRTTQYESRRAIYFSRCPIPYDRDKAGIGVPEHYLRHLGIYAYRKDFLAQITTLPQTPLEKLEKLEQLRAVENGYPILVGQIDHPCEGIDTPEQYAEFVERQEKQNSEEQA